MSGYRVVIPVSLYRAAEGQFRGTVPSPHSDVEATFLLRDGEESPMQGCVAEGLACPVSLAEGEAVLRLRVLDVTRSASRGHVRVLLQPLMLDERWREGDRAARLREAGWRWAGLAIEG